MVQGSRAGRDAARGSAPCLCVCGGVCDENHYLCKHPRGPAMSAGRGQCVLFLLVSVLSRNPLTFWQIENCTCQGGLIVFLSLASLRTDSRTKR